MSNEDRIVRLVAEILVTVRHESPRARVVMLTTARNFILTEAAPSHRERAQWEREVHTAFDAAEREAATWQ